MIPELIIIILIIRYFIKRYWQNEDQQDEDKVIDRYFSSMIDEFQEQRHGDHPEPEPNNSQLEPEAQDHSGKYDSRHFRADSGTSIIDQFKDQRCGYHAEYQFAVLFMSESKKLVHLSRNMKCKNNTTKLTDRDCIIFPPDEYVVNYVTARPNKLQGGKTEHAESLLLGKLDLLMDKFGESKCETIVLYTWLLPCKDCKTEIIEKSKGLLAKKKHVILAYTSKMKNETNEDGIVEELRLAGIEVRKVKYPQKLQPLKLIQTEGYSA